MPRSSATCFRRPVLAAIAMVGGLMPSAAMAVACNVTTLPANFGVYNPLASTPLSATGTVNVACTCTGVLDCVAFSYRIDLSAGFSGNTAAREMRAGSGRLQYNLYSDSQFSTVWGTGSAGSSMIYLVTLFGTQQTATVYARMPARQIAPVGSYTDSPAVTIIY